MTSARMSRKQRHGYFPKRMTHQFWRKWFAWFGKNPRIALRLKEKITKAWPTFKNREPCRPGQTHSPVSISMTTRRTPVLVSTPTRFVKFMFIQSLWAGKVQGLLFMSNEQVLGLKRFSHSLKAVQYSLFQTVCGKGFYDAIGSWLM